MQPSPNAISSRDFSRYGPSRVEITLPVGFASHGNNWQRPVCLEPLNGSDEDWTARVGRDLSVPRWVTKLLARKVSVDGKAIGEESAATLCVADRDALMMYLRILTFGPTLWGVTYCKNESCKCKLDIIFDLGVLELPLPKAEGLLRSSQIEYGRKTIDFSFREPNGRDQELIADNISKTRQRVWIELMSQCLLSFNGGEVPKEEQLEKLPAELLLSLNREMSEGMSRFDWDIELSCVECNKNFVSLLDIQDFFLRELQLTIDDLWEDVHHLAFYYNWSESSILSLSRWKRKLYLSYINRTLSN